MNKLKTFMTSFKDGLIYVPKTVGMAIYNIMFTIVMGLKELDFLWYDDLGFVIGIFVFILLLLMI